MKTRDDIFAEGDRVKFRIGSRVYYGSVTVKYEYELEIDSDEGKTYIIPYHKVICKLALVEVN
jgi:hypothetical protein